MSYNIIERNNKSDSKITEWKTIGVRIKIIELANLNRQLDRLNYSTLGDLVKDLVAGKITRLTDDKQIEVMNINLQTTGQLTGLSGKPYDFYKQIDVLDFHKYLSERFQIHTANCYLSYFEKYTSIFFGLNPDTELFKLKPHKRSWILQSIKKFGDYYFRKYNNRDVIQLIKNIIERYELNKNLDMKDRIYLHSFNGKYNFTGLTLEKTGIYNITSTIPGNIPTRNTAWTIISAQEAFLKPVIFLYSGLIAFFFLMITIASGKITRGIQYEIISFVLLSTIIFSIIGLIVSSELEVGKNSPIGFVIKRPIDINGNIQIDETTKLPKGEWVLNIGGEIGNNYSNGIQTPLNVLVFGLIGGYLRYLYNTPSRIRKTHTEIRTAEKEVLESLKDKNIDDIKEEHYIPETKKLTLDQLRIELIRMRRRAIFLFSSIEDLSLLLLAPLLAIAVWFILYQGGTTGIYAIAAVSISVGLVTEELVKGLIKFTQTTLRFDGEKEIKK